MSNRQKTKQFLKTLKMIVNSYGREAVSNPFLVAHICDGELTWFHPDMTDDQIAHCREKLNFLNRRKHDKGNNS